MNSPGLNSFAIKEQVQSLDILYTGHSLINTTVPEIKMLEMMELGRLL